MFGCVPRPCSRAAAPALALGELLLRCVVSHRIAPGEFLSGSFYVQAPVQFHPSSSAPKIVFRFGASCLRPELGTCWYPWNRFCKVPLFGTFDGIRLCVRARKQT